MPVTGKYKAHSRNKARSRANTPKSQTTWIYLWGEETESAEFERLLDTKFGTRRGARKTAMTALGINRRIMNMYITAQRRVPEDIMNKLRAMPQWDYEVDPLS